MYSKKNNRISQKTNNHNSIDVRYNKKENILIIVEKKFVNLQ